MARNVGDADRWLPIAAGAVPPAVGPFGPRGWQGLVGPVPLTTGLAGTCPVYGLLGLNTCPLERRNA